MRITFGAAFVFLMAGSTVAVAQAPVLDLLPHTVNAAGIPLARPFAHRESVTMYHDAASGYGVVQLGPMVVGTDSSVRLNALFKFKGKALQTTPATISISLVVTGDTASHASTQRITVATDSAARFTEVVKVRVPERLGGKVRETLGLAMSTARFLRVVNAQRAQLSFGPTNLSLTDRQLEALRDFASRLDVDQHRTALASSGGTVSLKPLQVRADAFSAADVDRRAAQRGALLAPKYPAVPLDQRRRRTVVIEYVVDTAGGVDTSTVRAHEPADSLFAAAVRAAAPDWRFSPAIRKARPVRQVMVQPMPFDPGEMPRSVELDVSQCAADTSVPPPQQIFLEAHVHGAAVPLPANRPPDYADELRKRRVRGQVGVQFVVNDSGRTVPCMVKVLTTSDPRLTESVRRALTDWKFQPAQIFGQPVAVLIQEVFRFPDRD